MNEDIPMKVIILGEANVGKSCLLQRYLTGLYIENQENTVGAKFLSKRVEYQKKFVKLNIWDTAGQERYQSFSKMYCRDAKAAILVYDLSNPSSIEGMKKWYKIMSEETLPADALVFIAGTKSDIGSYTDEIVELIQEFKTEIQADHILVSAKSGDGVEDLFMNIVSSYFKRKITGKQSIILNKSNHGDKEKNKSKCC